MSLSADAEEDGAVFDVDDTREEEEMAEGGEGLGKKAKKDLAHVYHLFDLLAYLFHFNCFIWHI